MVDGPKCPIVVKTDDGVGKCGKDAVNAIEFYDGKGEGYIVYRCREHTSKYNKVLIGPGAVGDGGKGKGK